MYSGLDNYRLADYQIAERIAHIASVLCMMLKQRSHDNIAVVFAAVNAAGWVILQRPIATVMSAASVDMRPYEELSLEKPRRLIAHNRKRELADRHIASVQSRNTEKRQYAGGIQVDDTLYIGVSGLEEVEDAAVGIFASYLAHELSLRQFESLITAHGALGQDVRMLIYGLDNQIARYCVDNGISRPELFAIS